MKAKVPRGRGWQSIRSAVERFARMMWEMRMINGLDAQRARDLAERDAIRAWLQRDGERVLPLP